MNKKVIYTAIFGTEYYLHDPAIVSDGYDYVCFTDNDELEGDHGGIWKLEIVKPYYTQGGLNNRMYKVIPHKNKILAQYDFSIYVDGDLKIIGDLGKLASEYESEKLSVLDHSLCGINVTGTLNTRDCIYDEANFIKWLGDKHPRKHYKGNIKEIFKQVNRYQAMGYPAHNGLGRTSLIFRQHNDQEVKKVMEDWWTELRYYGKRDQISFPYVCWKNNFKFKFIPEDIDSNTWIKLMKQWRKQRKRISQ